MAAAGAACHHLHQRHDQAPWLPALEAPAPAQLSGRAAGGRALLVAREERRERAVALRRSADAAARRARLGVGAQARLSYGVPTGSRGPYSGSATGGSVLRLASERNPARSPTTMSF